MDCSSCKADDLDFIIFESNHWRVTLSPDQRFLGRSYVTLKKHVESLSDLSQEEWLDYIQVVKRFELALKKSFSANLFNWTCLMNHSFQKKPYTPHVHWHVRPRYDKSIQFEGLTFEDKEFGHHYIYDDKRDVSLSIRKKIIQKIKKNLK